jgi:hypothetical protein
MWPPFWAAEDWHITVDGRGDLVIRDSPPQSR